MSPDRNLPAEFLPGALWCHFSVQVFGLSCRAGHGQALGMVPIEGENVPR